MGSSQVGSSQAGPVQPEEQPAPAPEESRLALEAAEAHISAGSFLLADYEALLASAAVAALPATGPPTEAGAQPCTLALSGIYRRGLS